MGNAACTGSFRDVTFPNPKDPSLQRCSDEIGDFIGMDETKMCYNPDSGQRFIMEKFCASIGSGSEWGRKIDSGEGCCRSGITGASGSGVAAGVEVNSKYAGVRLNDSNGCIGICDEGATNAYLWPSKNGECVRKSFRGDPRVCCFLDYDCSKREDLCFQTVDRGRTCDPKFRDVAGDDCLERIRPLCTGEELLLGQENWWDLWVDGTEVDINSGDTRVFKMGNSRFIPDDYDVPSREQLQRNMKQPCLNALSRAITRDKQFCTWESIKTLQIARGNFDPDGLTWAQGVVNEIFDRYIQDFGSFVGGITSSGKQISKMESVFREICTKFPILCRDPLKSVCQDITSEQIANRTAPLADVWCGCYMPDEEYQKYIDLYQVEKECTPFCNTSQAIPLADPDGYEKRCLQDVCIIDDLRLNFVKNKIDGDVNFTLLCGGCGGINVDKIITDGEDFNTKRSKLVGIFTNTILDTEVCSTIDVQNPFTDIFGNDGNRATVIMFSTQNPTNRINVTLELKQDGIGSEPGFSQYSIVFVDSEIIDEEYKFKNGEPLSIENASLPCDIFALTVKKQFVDGGKSSKYLLRNRQTAGSQCTCILEGTTINIVDSEIKGVNLVQNCGYGECFNDDNEPIPCSTNDVDKKYHDFYTPEEALREEKKKYEKKSFNLTALILMGVMVLLLIITLIMLFVPVKVFGTSKK